MSRNEATNHSKDYLVQNTGENRCDVYCYIDNFFDILDKMREKRDCFDSEIDINELVQIKLGQDYEIRLSFVKKEHLEDIEQQKQKDASIREGTLSFIIYPTPNE